jgi:acetyl esterase/lipase
MTPPRLLVGLMALAFAALTAPVAAQTSAPRAAAPAAKHTEDVVYGRKFGVALTLDVFQPAQGANGIGIIHVVSGGWRSAHENIRPTGYATYLARGYTVFAVVHGSQPRFVIEEIVPDIHRAVRFIRANAARWQIDPARLGIAGASAGGHLSITLGTQGGPGPATAGDRIDRESSAVQAVACFYPPTDFLNYGAEGESAVGVGTLQGYAAAFSSQPLTPEARRELGARISPVRFVSARMAPTLIIHGDADKLVPFQQAQLFAQRATAAGGNVRVIVKPGAEHGGKTWTDLPGDLERMADWFDQHLRGLPAKTR